MAQFDGYRREDSFPVPRAGASALVFDTIPDGRIILCDGQDVFLETAVASRSFAVLRPAGAAGGFTSFIRVSPNGQNVAMGNGDRVVVFDLTASPPQAHALDNYDAEWYDDTWLILSSVAGIDALDIVTGAVRRLITDIGGSPAGVTIDKDGNLFTGNGADADPVKPSRTGTIKVFLKATWTSLLTSGSPISFEEKGRTVAEFLSAASLGFDGEGNLHMGGSEFFVGDPDSVRDKGYAVVINANALADAMAGGSPIVRGASRGKLHIFARDPGAISYYVSANRVTKELYVSDYNAGIVQVFRMINKQDRVLVRTHALHFGDNPGVFHDAAYVGGHVTFPMQLKWFDPSPQVRKLRWVFRTQDLETWGNANGHAVLVNNTEIGRLKDKDDGNPEGIDTHTIAVSKADLLALIGPSGKFNLSITLERGPSTGGLADDFVLLRTETVDFTVKMGW